MAGFLEAEETVPDSRAHAVRLFREKTPAPVAGRYTLGPCIGEGAAGAVYEARHTLTGQTVALKLMWPGVLPPEELDQRFLREVRLVSSLNHPGVVRVLDAGYTDSGQPFFTMERLQGYTFETWMARRARRPDEVVAVVEQVLDVVAYAHERGILHRDLKPANIFLTRDDEGQRVKLLDFGLGFAAEDPRLTKVGLAMGTPAYMSPEAAMTPEDVGPASDVWSLGVLMYEAFCGEVPYDDPNNAVLLMKVCREEHEPMFLKAPHLPAPLAGLVDQCLAKDPDERPQDARELLQRLRALKPRQTAPIAAASLPGVVKSAPLPKVPRRITQPPPPRSERPEERREGPHDYRRRMTTASIQLPLPPPPPPRLAVVLLALVLL